MPYFRTGRKGAPKNRRTDLDRNRGELTLRCDFAGRRRWGRLLWPVANRLARAGPHRSAAVTAKKRALRSGRSVRRSARAPALRSEPAGAWPWRVRHQALAPAQSEGFSGVMGGLGSPVVVAGGVPSGVGVAAPGVSSVGGAVGVDGGTRSPWLMAYRRAYRQACSRAWSKLQV